MKHDPQAIYAVLTGDVVDSSKLSAEVRGSVVEHLKQAFQDTRSVFRSIIPYQIDVFRGDSWQFLVTKPKLSVRVAVCFRACLKSRWATGKLDSRVAIGLGTVETLVRRGISQSSGAAFEKSGKALETLKKHRRLKLVPNQESSEPYLDPVVWLLDALVTNWTPKESLAVFGVMQGLSQEAVGELWQPPISQQAVAKFLTRASWEAVESGLDLVANLIVSDLARGNQKARHKNTT